MEKKAAIGLSVNLLVIIIISLFILGGGIALLYKFMGGAKDIKKELDAQTQAQLERLLLDEGKKVALPGNTAYISPGDFHVFWIGILNIDDDFGEKFYINIELSQASDEFDEIIYLTDEEKDNINEWPLFYKDALTIKENQHHFEPVSVEVPKGTQKGTYIFNAWVTCECQSSKCIEKNLCNPYDYIKKFTVIVK